MSTEMESQNDNEIPCVVFYIFLGVNLVCWL